MSGYEEGDSKPISLVAKGVRTTPPPSDHPLWDTQLVVARSSTLLVPKNQRAYEDMLDEIVRER